MMSNSTYFFIILFVVFMAVLPWYLYFKSHSKPKETEAEYQARLEREREKRILDQEWEDQKKGYN